MRFAAVFSAFLAILSSSANAADICKAVAIRDVAAIEDPASIIPQGGYDTAITRVRKSDGFPSFCSHGGYCYPAASLKLMNCRVGPKSSYNDNETDYYSVDVIRSKVSGQALRRDDLDNRLLEMGLCSACAGNAAHLYITRPKSACAQTVRQALEGNPTAARKLQDDYDALCPYPRY